MTASGRPTDPEDHGRQRTRARLERFVAVARALPAMVGASGKTFDERAQATAAAFARRRQETLEAILTEARRLLDGTPADGLPSAHWLAQFQAHAMDAVDPRIAALFARVFADEALRPGSVGVRTVQRIGQLDPEDLDRFGKLARLAVGNFVVRLKDSVLADHGLEAEDLHYLEELGLLRTGGGHVKNFPSQLPETFQTHLLYGDRVLRVTGTDAHKNLVIPCFRLTRPGTEIAEAMALPVVNDYIVQIVEFLEKRGYAVSHASIFERSDRHTVTRYSRFSEIVSYDRARTRRKR